MKTVNVVFNVCAGTGALSLAGVNGADPRSVVFFNLPTAKELEKAIKYATATGADNCNVSVKGYNVAYNLRNFDLKGVAKGLTIAGLELDKAKREYKGQQCVIDSKYALSTPEIEKVYSCAYCTYVDKAANVSPESLTICVADMDKRNFRGLCRVSANKPLYKAVIDEGLPVDSDKVKDMIANWVNSVVLQAGWAKATKGIAINYTTAADTAAD